jgi:hypothetical protein
MAMVVSARANVHAGATALARYGGGDQDAGRASGKSENA